MESYNPQSTTVFLRKKKYAPRYIVLFSRRLRLQQTEAEQILWSRLSKKQLAGLRFRRQHPIRRFIVDFYCHRKRLVIEVDGKIHRKQKEYDRKREDILKASGYHVIRFTNEEILDDVDSVLMRIESFADGIDERSTDSSRNDIF